MNRRRFFWIPAMLQLALIWVLALIIGCFWGSITGLAVGMAVTTLIVLSQLYHLNILDRYLVDKDNIELSKGWGIWNSVFRHLSELSKKESNHRHDLQEMLTRFHQAMNFLPDGVIIMDDNYLLEWFNPMAGKYLHLNEQRDIGLKITSRLQHPDFINYIIQGRYTVPLEITLNGQTLLLQIVPFNQHLRLLVIHDRTETVRTEKIRQNFIANASHELRTPLTVINGFLEIALSQPEMDQKTRISHLSMMKEQGERMQLLIQDMLTLSNLESNENQPVREAFNVLEMIEKLYRDAQALSAGKQEITLKLVGPKMLNGNEEEIRTAFSNLITNAIRYTPEGGQINISWTPEKEGPAFTVQDSGIGIDPKLIPRLTERFYRVDKSRSRKVSGTGLGLSIVKHILLRHDAELQIQSEPGKGSQFTIQFSQQSLKDEPSPIEKSAQKI